MPYCGPPPTPLTLGASWNLDPPLLLALGALAVASCARALRASAALESERSRRLGALGGGLVLLALAFVSPLCSLGVALFSARVGQHLVLAVAVAPLLVVGLRRSAPALGRSPGDLHPLRPIAAGVCFALVLWLWHAPAPYDATLRGDGLYWSMHLTLLASACWLWSELLQPGRSATAAVLAIGTSIQMGFLGALLVFAPRPLYESHLATTAAWGISPLSDQALGGLLCWVPGCLVIAAAGLAPLGRVLRGEWPDAASAVRSMATAAAERPPAGVGAFRSRP